MHRPRLAQSISLVAVMTLALAILPAPAAAQNTIQVGCPGAGATTLPNAVANANTSGVPDVITLTPGCRYDLSSTLTILPDGGTLVEIDGHGATIDGGGAVRPFTVSPGARLTLRQVTVAHGGPAANDAGGIYNNRGTLRLVNSNVMHSIGRNGAGIVNRGGTVELVNSNVRYCDATGTGGGIFNNGGRATLVISDSSTISDNTAAVTAGGIANDGGSVTVTASRLSDNNSESGVGGMFNRDGPATFDDSTVSDNRGRRGGFVNLGDLRIANGSILTDNHSVESGGAIYNDSSLTITDSVVTDNDSEEAGGGISTTTNFTLTKSRVADNSAPSGGGIFVDGAFHDGGVATVQIASSIVAHNQAANPRTGTGTFRGGGIFMIDARVTATNSTRIAHNVAFGDGGGIFDGSTDPNIGVTLRLTDTTVSSNRAAGFQGGGITSFGPALIRSSTISDNEAAVGGGVANWSGLELNGSTVADNYASGTGGGIFTGVDMTGISSTISDNTAEESGGGIFNHGDVFLRRFRFTDN
ncbi:MAG TPA: hypothetical protein VIG64_09670, partial [Actinomycetota bacterium]